MSKDDTVKIKEVISISKKEILKKYCKMDEFFLNTIENLYLNNAKKYDLNKTIRRKSKKKKTRNNYKSFKSLQGTVGCYIFIKETTPVYVGVGGIKKKQDLAARIAQECRAYVKKGSTCKYSQDSGATLSQNIQEIEGLSADESMEKIKTFNLIPIIVKNLSDKESAKNLANRTQALEALLIALFDPKYNK